MATHSRILAWRSPWTEEPVGYSPGSGRESDTTERLSSAHLFPYMYTVTSWSVSPPDGAFVTTDEPTLSHHPEPTVPFTVLWW